MKTNKDVLTTVIVTIWLIVIIAVIFANIRDSYTMQTTAFGVNLGFILLFVFLIIAKDHFPKFKEWLNKPLKKDEEK